MFDDFASLLRNLRDIETDLHRYQDRTTRPGDDDGRELLSIRLKVHRLGDRAAELMLHSGGAR
jgi:hypothetical protein